VSLPVSIVIPTWNGRHLLERFLPSVIASAREYRDRRGASIEIVIVDDGSTDRTADWVASEAGRCSVTLRRVPQTENRGFGDAANRGMREAAFAYVWLLNNDVEVDVDAVDILAAAFAGEPADSKLLAVHSRMIDLATNREVGTGKMGGFARGFLRVHRSFVPRPPMSGPFSSMFATGGSAMFQRAVFLELGGFDPIFAPFYLEDVELSYRAWKRGFSVRYEPRSVVRHQFSSTIAPLAAGAQVERISQRNRLIFHWMHLHDARLFRAHVFWVALLTVTAPITMKMGFIRGFVDALQQIPTVLERRSEERGRSIRTDEEVLQIFQDLEASGRVQAYDDPRELASSE
jgi:GT2 family glycosyltransferase